MVTKKMSRPKIGLLKYSLLFVIGLLVIAYLGNFFSRAQSGFTIDSGLYTGNGSSQNIVGLSFKPDLVFIKGNFDIGHSVFFTSAMTDGRTHYISKGAQGFKKGVTSLNLGGFSVGSDINVNDLGAEYHWVALGNINQENFHVGSYTGDGKTDRLVSGLGFKPDLIWVKGENKERAIGYTTAMKTQLINMYFSDVNAPFAITDTRDDGFVLSSSKSVNQKNTEYYYVAFKNTEGAFKMGGYVGDGQLEREIIDPGFRPVWVLDKDTEDTEGWQHSRELLADASLSLSTGVTQTDHIVGLTDIGFRVGSALNHLSDNYFWVAFANQSSGSPTPPDSISKTIAGTGSRRSQRPIPIISSLSSYSGGVGDVIKINGSNFGDSQEASKVYFNNIEATKYISWADNLIVLEVPAGDIEGEVMVFLESNVLRGGVWFAGAPKITEINPSHNIAGEIITISGDYFGPHQNSSKVVFGKVEAASYVSWSSKKIVVKVPDNNQVRFVDLVVERMPYQDVLVNSNKVVFDYAGQPKITAISPTYGYVGQLVTILGQNLGLTKYGLSYLQIGKSVIKNYPQWDDNHIVFQIPLVGNVGILPLTVHTAGGVSNELSFNVTQNASAANAPEIRAYRILPQAIDISGAREESLIWKVLGINFNRDKNKMKVMIYNLDTGWMKTNINSSIASSENEFGEVESEVEFTVLEASKLRPGSYSLFVEDQATGKQDFYKDLITIYDKLVEVSTEEEAPAIETPGRVPKEQPDASALNRWLNNQYSQVVDMLRGLIGSPPAAAYRYEIVDSPASIVMQKAQTTSARIKLKNTGTVAWYGQGDFHLHLGTVSPVDRKSLFASADNEETKDANRLGVLENYSVAPGEIGTFVIDLYAPNGPGKYKEYLKPVAEGLAWLTGPIVNLDITVQ